MKLYNINFVPIRDPSKQPTQEEIDNLRAPLSTYEAVALAQREYEYFQQENPDLFTDVPIVESILEEERLFQISQGKVLSFIVPLSDGEEEEEEEGIATPVRSVASIDSIQHQADFENQSDFIAFPI